MSSNDNNEIIDLNDVEVSGSQDINDISLDKKYSSICGISESEINTYFDPEIKALADEQEISIEVTKEKLAEKIIVVKRKMVFSKS